MEKFMEIACVERRFSARELFSRLSEVMLEIARCSNEGKLVEAKLIINEEMTVLIDQLVRQPQENEVLIGRLAGCSFDDYLDDLTAWMRLKRKQLDI